MFDDFYRGKRVLVTGHTGFKGGWLSLWLKHIGAAVHGISLPAPTNPNFYELIGESTFASQTECDVRDFKRLRDAIERAAPDIAFHLAAQPLVRQSYAEPLATFEVNALGTANVLEAIRQLGSSCSVVVITTDKVYENRGWDFGYREADPLGGHDPYSASKAAAELVVNSWRQSFFSAEPKLGNIASARGGNVIGGGDYGRDRIVPDCVRALMEGQPIVVRNPNATRPWQHVFDCLSGYLALGTAVSRAPKNSPMASAFNFGPGTEANLPVSTLVEEILRVWPGKWQHVAQPNAPHEAEKLNLAIDKAVAMLGWRPVWRFDEAIRQTTAWYHERHVTHRADMIWFSIGQIDSYARRAAELGVAWTKS